MSSNSDETDSDNELTEDELTEAYENKLDEEAFLVQKKAMSLSVQEGGDGSVELFDDIMKDTATELGTIQFGTLLREKGSGATLDYLKFNYGPYTLMTGKGKVRGRITKQCEDVDTFKFRFCDESGNLSEDITEYTMRVIQDTIKPFTDSHSINKYDTNRDGIVQEEEYIKKETEEQKRAKEIADKELAHIKQKQTTIANNKQKYTRMNKNEQE